MKQLKKRAAALALALAMSLGCAGTALASVALGESVVKGSADLSIGTTLTQEVFWSSTYSDLRTENYIAYTPNYDVSPVVSYGSSVLSRNTLTALARELESQGKRVVGGINGDYYVLATGAPLGLVITDGVLRSSASHLYAVGFEEDGTTFIGSPALTMTASFGGHTLILADINKVRTETGGYFLFTGDFGATTQNTSPGVDVILTPLSDRLGEQVEATIPATDGGTATTRSLVQRDYLSVGGRVTCRVERVLQSTGAVAIPAGSFVLSINNKSNDWLVSELSALVPGDTVDLDISSADTRFERADQAVGGMYKLVTGGVVQQGLETGQNPRSAIGVRADGTAVFYTIDGRRSGYSVGASLTQVAQRLVELGCVEAVCLDGGGSTTIGAALPDQDGMTLVNVPSEGTERANTNAIFLVSHLSKTGVPSHLFLTPYRQIALSGAQVPIEATVVDTGWYAMGPAEAPAWSVYNSDGTITAAGVFTAGAQGGVSQINATQGVLTGSTTITVVKTPDVITLFDQAGGPALSQLALSPGQVIDLKATASYRNLALTAQDTCFTWSVSGGAGAVDENGLFTASLAAASGTLTVSAGERTVSIPVSVAGHVLLLENFEGDTVSTVTASDTVSVAIERGGTRVRYGHQSLRFSYDAASGRATAGLMLVPAAGERFLSLWIYGDGSGNVPAITVTTAQDDTELLLPALDYTGWRKLTVALPDGATALTALRIIYSGIGPASGVLWIDQITTANDTLEDSAPPVVSLTESAGQYTATVTDNLPTPFLRGQVSVTLDGAPLSFQWDATTGKATFSLPAGDGLLRRLTVTASDASGNLGRASRDVAPVAARGSYFIDTAGHWAAAYADALFAQGVTTGIDAGTGLQFQPGKDITRGEFFLMAARWMGIDPTQYTGTELPFADLGSIPGWALDGVKAMYARGILQGTLNNGRLTANTGATISRAEAMTILGRIQAKGYAMPALNFTDAAQVPAWAADYVRSLVGQGAVSGYDGRISPLNPITRAEVAKLLFALQ